MGIGSTRRAAIRAGVGIALARPLIARAQAARTITVGGFGGPFQDLFAAAVIDPFRRATGIGAYYYPVGSSLQMLAFLRLHRGYPEIDVAIANGPVALTASAENLLDPLPPDRLALGDWLAGARIPNCAAPGFAIDTMALIYAPDRLRIDSPSWRYLWDGNLGRGLAVVAPPDPAGLALVLAASRYFGVGDLPGALDGGLPAIARLAPKAVSWDPKPSVYDFIQDGNASIGIGWNAAGQVRARKTRGALRSVVPETDKFRRVQTVGIVKGSQRPEAARMFVEYCLSAPAQTAISQAMGYAPASARVPPAADAAPLESGGVAVDIEFSVPPPLRAAIASGWRDKVMRRL